MRFLLASLLLLSFSSVLAQPRTEAGHLGPGDDTLESGEYVDTYAVAVEAGQRLTVDLTSDDFDPYLIVLSPSDEQTDNDDWEGSYSHSRVEIGDTESGTWRVRVTSYEPGETGGYTLTLGTGSDPGVQTHRGTITDDDPLVPLTAVGNERRADRYEVRLGAGQTFEAELTSDDFDTYLRLELDGERVAFNDDADGLSRSYLEYVAEWDGTYTLYAGTFAEDERGAYTLRYATGEDDVIASLNPQFGASPPAPRAPPPPAGDAFATTLNRLVNGYPDFDGLLGDYDEEAEHHRARVALPGADESYFNCFDRAFGGHCAFIATFGDFATEAEAERAYRALVDRVQAVRFDLSSFVYDERVSEASRLTYWLPFADNADDLVLEVETIHNPFAEMLDEPPYGVVLRVKSI